MDKTEFLNKITEIGTCEDDATRRALLTEINDGVSEVFDNVATLTETNENLTKNNNDLLEKNMQLFLRVSTQKAPADPDPSGAETKPVRKYEDLFNEKGELK